MSRDLALDEQRITDALVTFPGLFRRGSVNETEVGPQHSYPLHARYALRRPREPEANSDITFDGRSRTLSDPTPEQDGRGEELDAETLRTSLDFVSQEARTEGESARQRLSQLWLLVGVGVAAIVAAIASIVSAVIRTSR